MLAALGAHTGWGAYPVLARYLQTVSDLPSMALLAAGNAISIALVAPLFLPRFGLRVFAVRALWLFALVVVARAITNLLAARYTLAIYVQLITLLTPFIVVILGASLFREPIPPATWWALGLSLGGSLLMMSGDLGNDGIGLALTWTDALGISLAFASSFSLALYMLLVPRMVKAKVPAEAVFIVQLVVLTVTSTLISLVLGEDWQRWTEIGVVDWVVFGMFTAGVLLGSNLAQIGALRHLGAPLVSSIMGWRLISALALGALLLGERLTSFGQVLGAVIVLVTITWYLWRQQQPRPAPPDH